MTGVKERRRQWFQQDGVAPHVSRLVLQWISNHFGTRCISRRTRHPWSANSPDLSPLDFHLWGFWKTDSVVMIFRTYKSWKLLSLMLCRTSHRTNVDESWSTLAVSLRNESKCVGDTLNTPCDLINYHFVNKMIWQCTISICIWLFYVFVLSNWPMEVISVRRFVVSSFDTLIFNYNVRRFVEC